MKTDADDDKLIARAAAIEAAMREVLKDVVLKHKQAGLPLADWRDGKVVWIPADQVVIDD